MKLNLPEWARHAQRHGTSISVTVKTASSLATPPYRQVNCCCQRLCKVAEMLNQILTEVSNISHSLDCLDCLDASCL